MQKILINDAIQYLVNFLPLTNTQKTYRLRNLFKKNEPLEWGDDQEKDFNLIKLILTETLWLARYAKDKVNMVTTDASKTGLGITLSQNQDRGELKPIAFCSRFLDDTEKLFNW